MKKWMILLLIGCAVPLAQACVTVNLGGASWNEDLLAKKLTAAGPGWSMNVDRKTVEEVSAGEMYDWRTTYEGVIKFDNCPDILVKLTNLTQKPLSEGPYDLRFWLKGDGESADGLCKLDILFAEGYGYESKNLTSEPYSWIGWGTIMTGQAKVCCVPAPGAILLAGLGTGLVGWLRKRRMV